MLSKNKPFTAKVKSGLRAAAIATCGIVSSAAIMSAGIYVAYYSVPVGTWYMDQMMNPEKPFVPSQEQRQAIASCQRALDKIDFMEAIVDQYVKDTGKKMPIQDIPSPKAISDALGQACADGIMPPPRETLSQKIKDWDNMWAGSPRSVNVYSR